MATQSLGDVAKNIETKRRRAKRKLVGFSLLMVLSGFAIFFLGGLLWILRTHDLAFLHASMEIPVESLTRASAPVVVALSMYGLTGGVALVGVVYFKLLKTKLDDRALQIGLLMVPLAPELMLVKRPQRYTNEALEETAPLLLRSATDL